MSDYISLGPDDVIQEGDQHAYKWHPWMGVAGMIGKRVSDFSPYSYKFRRPRSVFIREAAIAVLRRWHSNNMEPNSPAFWMAAEMLALEQAVGLSLSELRGES